MHLGESDTTLSRVDGSPGMREGESGSVNAGLFSVSSYFASGCLRYCSSGNFHL